MQHRAYLMRLKKDRVQDYIAIHRKGKIWKSIINGLVKTRFDKMIIFLLGQEVILFEEAEDLKAAYQSFDNDAETVKWDKLMDSWMENYPKFNEIKGDVEVTEIRVVFYYENGKLLHGEALPTRPGK